MAVRGESGTQRFFVLVGTGQGSRGQGLRNIPGGRWRSQQFLACWQSGGLLGSVVPRGAADSLLHGGEVLCLAKFSAQTRHIGVAQVNTETLSREGKRRHHTSASTADKRVFAGKSKECRFQIARAGILIT